MKKKSHPCFFNESPTSKGPKTGCNWWNCWFQRQVADDDLLHQTSFLLNLPTNVDPESGWGKVGFINAWKKPCQAVVIPKKHIRFTFPPHLMIIHISWCKREHGYQWLYCYPNDLVVVFISKQTKILDGKIHQGLRLRLRSIRG